MISNINIAIPTKEPMRDPEIRSQKLLNCWQIANQLALGLPLCAKYTMPAAAEAPAVRTAIITFTDLNNELQISCFFFFFFLNIFVNHN